MDWFEEHRWVQHVVKYTVIVGILGALAVFVLPALLPSEPRPLLGSTVLRSDAPSDTSLSETDPEIADAPSTSTAEAAAETVESTTSTATTSTVVVPGAGGADPDSPVLTTTTTTPTVTEPAPQCPPPPRPRQPVLGRPRRRP